MTGRMSQCTGNSCEWVGARDQGEKSAAKIKYWVRFIGMYLSFMIKERICKAAKINNYKHI